MGQDGEGGKRMSIIIRLATAKDIKAMKRLLQRANLNQEGIETDLHQFLVTENVTDDRNSIVAMAGIEQKGEYGFLRSFVMESEIWNTLVGLELIKIALRYAKQRGCKEVYLLTTVQASYFFHHIGFQSIGIEEVPLVIQESLHFKKSYQQDVVIMKL